MTLLNSYYSGLQPQIGGPQKGTATSQVHCLNSMSWMIRSHNIGNLWLTNRRFPNRGSQPKSVPLKMSHLIFDLNILSIRLTIAHFAVRFRGRDFHQ